MARALGKIEEEVSIEVRSNPITVDSALGTSDPDLTWDYTDEAGHYHWWVNEGDRPRTPTLIEVDDETYWCPDCRDDHTDSHLECRICGEHIEPGYTTRSNAFPQVIAGPTEVILRVAGDEVPVTSDEYQALRAFRQGTGLPAMASYARKLAERLPE